MPSEDDINWNKTIGKDFTYMEILSNIWWVKIFIWPLKLCDCKCLKNDGQFA